MLYGAVAGTLPDLDIIASPFVTDVQSFTGHRSATHSLLLLPFAAVLLAWAAFRLKLAKLSFHRWWFVLSAILLTHPLLDLMTSYGTQIFWPLSRYPYATSSIFIIDPLFTLPLLLALYLLYRKTPPATVAIGTAPVGAALLWGCLYLAIGFGLKTRMTAVAEPALPIPLASLTGWEVQNSLPTMLSWKVIAVGERAHYSSTAYFWQRGEDLVWRQRPHYSRRAELVELMRASTEHNRLMQFSKGLFDFRDLDGTIVYHDLRFARTDENSVFGYEVARITPSGQISLIPPLQLPRSF